MTRRYEVYTLRKIKVFWVLSAWEILYDDTPIRKFYGEYQDASTMVSLLNTVWNLGYQTGVLDTKYSSESNNIPVTGKNISD